MKNPKYKLDKVSSPQNIAARELLDGWLARCENMRKMLTAQEGVCDWRALVTPDSVWIACGPTHPKLRWPDIAYPLTVTLHRFAPPARADVPVLGALVDKVTFVQVADETDEALCERIDLAMAQAADAVLNVQVAA